MEQSISFVIGIDLGDRVSHACVLSKETGGVVERRRLATTRKGFCDLLQGRKRSLVAIEVGTHSAWVSRLISELDHEVLVGDARRLAFIFKSNDKSDRSDAENLARVARLDPGLLYPIQHRAETAQVDLAVLRVRNGLVEVRTKLINRAPRQDIPAFLYEFSTTGALCGIGPRYAAEPRSVRARSVG